MRFTVSQPDFQEAFNRVSPAVPSKTTLPILSHVLFQLEGDVLRLVATDLEVSIVTEIQVQGEQDGSISVPSKKIGDIVRELDDFSISFHLDDSNHLILKAGEGSYHVPGIDAQEFPSLPEFEGATEVNLNPERFERIITRTVFAVSKDELRPALTGVFFQLRPHEIRAVSTDGHRLVRIVDQTFEFNGDPRELILPVKALDMIKRNLPDEETVTLSLGSNQIMVKLPDAILYSRLIEGKYPHYESVIPQGNSEEMTVDVMLLEKSVKRAQIFSNPINKQVVFHIDTNRLEITAEDIELGGRGSESVEVNYSGEAKKIGYNAAYVIDLLKHINTEEVIFLLGGTTAAGIVRPTQQIEGEDFLMLIMPVRLS